MMNSTGENRKNITIGRKKALSFKPKKSCPNLSIWRGVEWSLNVWKIKLNCSRQVPTVFQNITAQKSFSHLIPELHGFEEVTIFNSLHTTFGD